MLKFSHWLGSPVAHADRVIVAVCVGESSDSQGGGWGVGGDAKVFGRFRNVFLFEMNPSQPRKQLTER